MTDDYGGSYRVEERELHRWVCGACERPFWLDPDELPAACPHCGNSVVLHEGAERFGRIARIEEGEA